MKISKKLKKWADKEAERAWIGKYTSKEDLKQSILEGIKKGINHSEKKYEALWQ